MGHEFIGEVVGHGPDCSGDFPIGTRVTSMPLLIRAGEEPLVIGHDPDAPGAFGELMLVSEVMSAHGARRRARRRRRGRRRIRGGGVLRSLFGASGRASCRWSSARARSAFPRWRRWRRAASARSSCRITATTGWHTPRNSAPTSWSILASAHPYDVWRERGQEQRIQTPQVIFECVGAPGLLQSIVGLVRVHGAGVRGGRLARQRPMSTAPTPRTRASRSSSAAARIRRTGTARSTRSPTADSTRCPASAGSSALTRSPTAIDQVRKSQGPPRVVVHPRHHERAARPIRQIGYVVSDLDAALASWVELGVGPWLVMRGIPIRALTAANHARPRCRWRWPTAASCRSS